MSRHPRLVACLAHILLLALTVIIAIVIWRALALYDPVLRAIIDMLNAVFSKGA